MFAEYVVLFVGYSHSDVVMQYMARAFVLSISITTLVPRGAESEARSPRRLSSASARRTRSTRS
jgi:hypothetical protein